MLKSPSGRRVMPGMGDSFMIRGVMVGSFQEKRRNGREDPCGRDESVGVDGRREPDAAEGRGLKSRVIADDRDVQGAGWRMGMVRL